MAEFRKRPVVIEAHLYDSAAGYFDKMPPWLVEAYEGDTVSNVKRDNILCVKIKTLEGHMYASPGDWIIRGVKGELYPCKPDIFAATYEPA